MLKRFMFSVIGVGFSVASLITSCITIAFITGTLFTFFYHIAIAVSNNAYGSMSGVAAIGIELTMNLIGCIIITIITGSLICITIECYKKGEKKKEGENVSQGVSSEGSGIVG